MYWLTAIIGLLFAGAPFVLGYADNQPALWTSLIVGAGVVVAAAFEAAERDKDPIEYWLTGLLGIAAVAAPFVFNFDGVSAAMWTSLIGGGLLAVSAFGRLLVKPGLTYA